MTTTNEETPPLSNKEDPDGTVYCKVCGGTRVQYAVWFAPNTNQVLEDFGSWNATDSKFCADCDENGRDPNPPLTMDPDEIEGVDPADPRPEDRDNDPDNDPRPEDGDNDPYNMLDDGDPGEQ